MEQHHLTSLDYYATEELLTDDERAARDRTRRFVQDEVMPVYPEPNSVPAKPVISTYVAMPMPS